MYANIAGILVANPINVHFLWKKNVRSRYLTYINPVLIGAGFYLFWMLILPSHWLFRVAVLFLYLSLSFVFKVLIFDDLVIVFEQIKKLFKIQTTRQTAACDATEVVDQTTGR